MFTVYLPSVSHSCHGASAGNRRQAAGVFRLGGPMGVAIGSSGVSVVAIALLWSAPAAAQAAPAEPYPTEVPPPVLVAPPVLSPAPDAPIAEAAPPKIADAPTPISEDDIVITAKADWEAPDPLAGVNEKSFEVTQAVDTAVIAPVSRAYKKNVPGPFRRGVHNVLYNLREPVVFLNFVLQHKIGKAAETVARFAINTTVGIAGIFDMARRKPFKLPRRSNGFANTLGFYGVPSGPFLYLPIVGPTTVRDIFGGGVDRLMIPTMLGQGVTDPKFAIPAGVLGMLDHRAEFDETYKDIYGKADPYASARDFYLQRRQAEIDYLKRGSKGPRSPMSDPPRGPVSIKPRSGTQIVPATPAPAAPVAAEPVPATQP